MENAEEIFHFLEEFSKRKTKTIPQELNDYLAYVARTGDPVYQWSLVKCLFKEKLLNVITDFYETVPSIDIPPYPNVDPFNYDIMKNSLLERLDSFNSAPFTVQRICELLAYPRKQYNRVDKFMRAVEKNILVVSTREPGVQRLPEPENGEPMEPIINGSDNNSEYNVDVEMEDMTWKENTEMLHNSEPQPSSSDTHISVDDLETRLQTNKPPDTEEVMPPNSVIESASPKTITEDQPDEEPNIQKGEKPEEVEVSPSQETNNSEIIDESPKESPEMCPDTEMTIVQPSDQEMSIPEIKVDDAEMTEQKLLDENTKPEKEAEETKQSDGETKVDVQETITPINIILSDESSSDSNCKEETETKNISEVLISSEESSCSSDITDYNSNSPNIEVNICSEETSQSDKNVANSDDDSKEEIIVKETEQEEAKPVVSVENASVPQIQSDNYSISDVNSEIRQVTVDAVSEPQKDEPSTTLEETVKETQEAIEEVKQDTPSVEPINTES